MIKSLNIHHLILLFITFFTIGGCTESPHTRDLDAVELSLDVLRFEQKLFACENVSDITTLGMEFPDFYNVYTKDIIGSNVRGPLSTEKDVAVELYKYIAHPQMDSLYEITSDAFGDFEKERKELNEACKYIFHYFPEEKIENVVTFISTFQYGCAYDALDKKFVVGLDLYLGSDFEVYQLIDPQNFPVYRIKKFEPYRIVPNCIQTFANHIVPPYSSTTFMDQAIYEGKKLYLLDLLLPEHHDSLKINYLYGQLEWAESQEQNIWSYFIEKEVLFSSDKNEIQRHYFNDGPFTSPFGNESSPRTGAWVGWQIVRAYMARYPEISIHDLIADKNHQAIFQKSKYRP